MHLLQTHVSRRHLDIRRLTSLLNSFAFWESDCEIHLKCSLEIKEVCLLKVENVMLCFCLMTHKGLQFKSNNNNCEKLSKNDNEKKIKYCNTF